MLATQNGNCNYGNESLHKVISEEDLLVYKMNIQKKIIAPIKGLPH